MSLRMRLMKRAMPVFSAIGTSGASVREDGLRDFDLLNSTTSLNSKISAAQSLPDRRMLAIKYSVAPYTGTGTRR